MVKRIFKFRRWRPRVNPTKLHRKSWDATKKVERGLESIVGISLRLGTLVLLIALFVFLYRTLTDQRYVIKAFSVPQHLEKNGFTGAVVAARINDEVVALKEYEYAALPHAERTAAFSRPPGAVREAEGLNRISHGLRLLTLSYLCIFNICLPPHQIDDLCCSAFSSQ